MHRFIKKLCINTGCTNWLPDKKSCTYGADEMQRIHQLSVNDRKCVQLKNTPTIQSYQFVPPTTRGKISSKHGFRFSRPTLMAIRAGAMVTFERLGPGFLLQYL